MLDWGEKVLAGETTNYVQKTTPKKEDQRSIMYAEYLQWEASKWMTTHLSYEYPSRAVRRNEGRQRMEGEREGEVEWRKLNGRRDPWRHRLLGILNGPTTNVDVSILIIALFFFLFVYQSSRMLLLWIDFDSQLIFRVLFIIRCMILSEETCEMIRESRKKWVNKDRNMERRAQLKLRK